MKSLLKRLFPLYVWEGARGAYSKVRRFALDLRDSAQINPFAWATLFSLVRFVRPTYTMVSVPRLHVLYDLSRRLKGVSGDFVECGVYNGGSAAIAVYADERDSSRHTWLFDSFEGLPPPTDKDGARERDEYRKGWCEGSVERVREVFGKLSLPRENLHIVKGWFADTFPRESANVGPIALLHIDADWYESVKICLETFYPKVVSGGYVVFDDYGTWEGCKTAADEFMAREGIHAKLETRDGRGSYFRKP